MLSAVECSVFGGANVTPAVAVVSRNDDLWSETESSICLEMTYMSGQIWGVRFYAAGLHPGTQTMQKEKLMFGI